LSRDKDTGKFAHRDAVTMADICVVGQSRARGLQCRCRAYPTVKRITETCMAIEAFAKEHPLKRPARRQLGSLNFHHFKALSLTPPRLRGGGGGIVCAHVSNLCISTPR